MNLKRGLQRIFFVVVLVWIAFVATAFPLTIDHARSYGYWENFNRVVTTPLIFRLLEYALLPPTIIYFVIGLIVWVIRGFKKDRPVP